MSAVIESIDLSEFNGDGLEIVGRDGFDILFGTQLDDLVDAKAGNDLIMAGDGDDGIIGGDGNDRIKAGVGDDIIIGGTGVDKMTGGSGDDVFELVVEDLFDGSIDKITDFSESDKFKDIIRLRGIAGDAVVEYDSDTGLISVRGEDIIQVDPGLDINIDNIDGDGIWELF